VFIFLAPNNPRIVIIAMQIALMVICWVLPNPIPVFASVKIHPNKVYVPIGKASIIMVVLAIIAALFLPLLPLKFSLNLVSELVCFCSFFFIGKFIPSVSPS